jgi:sortase A
MAGGKHSAGKKDRFFGDWKKRHEDEFFEEGTNDREELDINEYNKFKETIKNYKEEEKEEAFKPNFDYDDNREETKNDYDEEDAEEDDYEEDSFVSGLNKATTAVKILIAITAIVVIIGGVFVVRKIFSPKPEEHKEEQTEVVEKKMESSIEGYKVLGKIKIDKIDVEQYILDSTDEKALKAGVGKLNGGSLNQIGNFAIVGHNFDKFFKRLPELRVGDTIVIIDKNMKETSYNVTDINEVDPDDLTSLLTQIGKTEITLITCQDGATKRFIIKAEKTKVDSTKTEGQEV